MPPQRIITSSKEGKVRQRSSRACQPCRKRKIKCDGKEPCEACVGYGYDCIYVERQSHKAPSNTVVGSPAKDVEYVAEDVLGPVAEPKINDPAEPYVATESLVTELTTEPFLLQSLRTRFNTAYSAIAWPKVLGDSLDMPTPPRLQSYGWNPGHRLEPEPKVVPKNNICNIITLQEMERFSDVYFNVVNPIFGILDRELYTQRSAEFWTLQKRGTDFEAIMCGVVALGSYFAKDSPLPAEAQVIDQGRLLLELTVEHAPAWLSVKHVQAWILRAIYLRHTTRPHLAWMASNTAVHLAEALGLHREITESQIKRDLPRLSRMSEINVRRKVFWMCMAANQYLSCEYGRTKSTIELSCCQQPSFQTHDLSSQTLAILQCVPRTQNLLGRGQELLETLDAAMALPVNAPFLSLLRADACFCTFRMLRSTNVSLSSAQITSLLEVIRVALDGATFAVSMVTPWWNVVGTPFHSVCILLGLGTSDALALIPMALKTLQNSSTEFDSHLSREALVTAQALVQAARTKRSKELESLDIGLRTLGDSIPSPIPHSASSEVNLQWSMDNDLGLSDFLDFDGYGFDNEAFLPPNMGIFSSGGQSSGV